jgi:hypothetical protein
LSDPAPVAAQVRAAFEHVEYPGDAYPVGSIEGCEPEGEAIDAALADQAQRTH